MVLLRPGRASYGERRRSETWQRLVTAAGGRIRTEDVLAGRLRPTGRGVLDAIRGRIVPEAAAWDGARLARRLRTDGPDVVICQTARTVSPAILDGPWTTVVDLVDLLSISYRQRAGSSRRVVSGPLRVLAWTHQRYESRAAADHRVVLAGRAEAEQLGGQWIPNLLAVEEVPAPVREARFDVVFFGTLGYRPNVEALQWLAKADPASAGLRVLVAGHRPTGEVRKLCSTNGWTLVEDYPSNDWLRTQAKVAIVPLRSTSGIQNKVLEAAAIGLAQVVTPAALAGIGSDLPCRVADHPTALVSEARALVDDYETRADLAGRAHHYVARHYTCDAWLPAFERIIGRSIEAGPDLDRGASTSVG